MHDDVDESGPNHPRSKLPSRGRVRRRSPDRVGEDVGEFMIVGVNDGPREVWIHRHEPTAASEHSKQLAHGGVRLGEMLEHPLAIRAVEHLALERKFCNVADLILDTGRVPGALARPRYQLAAEVDADCSTAWRDHLSKRAGVFAHTTSSVEDHLTRFE